MLRVVSPTKRALLRLQGILYVATGSHHLVEPGFYVPIMPPVLPYPLVLIWGVGLAKIGLGLALQRQRFRPWAAWGLIALLLAIFPANVYMAIQDVPLGNMSEGLGTLNWLRLPCQGVFILWAWWYTRPDAPAADSALHPEHHPAS